MGNVSKAHKTIPLVVVLGPTNCGKSRLAIELAERFQGEIISADSMQIYKGLDIVTNKVSKEEQKLAKHHMIDFVDPLKKYSVVDFQTTSLKMIDKLMTEKKIPIIVGGTHYYIESILWKEFLIQKSNIYENLSMIDNELQILNDTRKDLVHTEDDICPEKILTKTIYLDSFKGISPEKLWKVLEQLDPRSAYMYHPNDTRRVQRALQILQTEKKSMNEVLDKKNIIGEHYSRGGPLRYEPTCLFWLDCDKETLDKRLDERVDKMLESGLVKELEDFHKEYNLNRTRNALPHDYTRGVFQTIGFKEFHDYLMLKDEKEKASERGQNLLKTSLENMKIATRRYAKKQNRWITRRMLDQSTRDLPPIFRLDVTKVLKEEESWDKVIRPLACTILESFLNETKLPNHILPYIAEPERRWDIQHSPGKFYCEICEKTILGTYLWNIHITSGKHKKRLASLGKKSLASQTSDQPVNCQGGVAKIENARECQC